MSGLRGMGVWCIPPCTWPGGVYVHSPAPEMATDVVGTHPTGIHSCW